MMEKKGWQHSHVYTTENGKDKVPAFTSQSTSQNAVIKEKVHVFKEVHFEKDF